MTATKNSSDTQNIRCDHCNSTLQFSTTACGRQAPCPVCSHVIKIPSYSPDYDSASIDRTDIGYQTHTKKQVRNIQRASALIPRPRTSAPKYTAPVRMRTQSGNPHLPITPITSAPSPLTDSHTQQLDNVTIENYEVTLLTLKKNLEACIKLLSQSQARSASQSTE